MKENAQGREEIEEPQARGRNLPSNPPPSLPPVETPSGKEEAGAVRGAERRAASTHRPPAPLPGGREVLRAAWPCSLDSARRGRRQDWFEMRPEGELKMLGESSCASRSPRCGAVGAGPALLKGKPGPQGRERRAPRRRRPARSPDVTRRRGEWRRKWEGIYGGQVAWVLWARSWGEE